MHFNDRRPERATPDPDDYSFTDPTSNTNRSAMLASIRDAWGRGNDETSKILYSLQDGYGEQGHVPEQGVDWSGIRDSSGPAVRAMFAAVHA